MFRVRTNFHWFTAALTLNNLYLAMHIWFGPRSAWPFDYQSNFYSLHSSIRWYVLMISLKCICWPTLMIPRGHFACKRNQINSSIIVDFTWWKSHRRHSRTYNSILLKKTTTKWNILISCWNWSFVNWPATTRNIILRIQVLHKLKKKKQFVEIHFHIRNNSVNLLQCLLFIFDFAKNAIDK